MRDITLYLDETGDFVHPGTQSDATGLRLVGGLLLPGTPEGLDRTLRPRVWRAFGAWRGAWHATEVRNPYKLAKHLLDLDLSEIPPALHPAVERLAAAPRAQLATLLKDRANLALYSWVQSQSDQIFRRVAALVPQLSPIAVVAAVEHDTFPASTRYPDMLSAALQYALWALRDGPDSDAIRLHVRIEERSDLRTLPALDVMENRFHAARQRAIARGAAAGRPVTFAHRHPQVVRGADECPGLVLADVLLYHLREVGRVPSDALRVRDVELFSREGFRELLASDLGIDLPAPLIASTGVPRETLLDVEAGTLGSREAALRLAPPTIPLSDGLVRASWQTAADLLASWMPPS